MASILLAGFDPATAERLRTELAADAAVLTAGDEAEALGLLDGIERGLVVCLGDGLPGGRAQRLLEQVVAGRGGTPSCNIVLAAGPEPELFQELVDEDQLYYLSQKLPPPADVAGILRSALAAAESRQGPADGDDDERATVTRRVLAVVQQLAGEISMARVGALTAKAAEQLADADHAECLLYDPASETLWSRERATDEEERRESAAAGVVSFVLRTGAAVSRERIGDDPRYDPGIDTVGDDPARRFLAVPVVTAESGALAVLVALRPGSREPFGERERAALELLAAHVAPVLGRLALEADLEQAAERRRIAAGEERIFRRQALEHHARGFQAEGQLLHISPSWMPWAYRCLALLFVAALVYTTVGSIHEYASGPAVVRVEGRSDVTATLSGTVMAIDVAPGQRVAAGQQLVRLYGAQEAAELERIERELEQALLNRLADPADPSTEQVLGSLRAQQQLARARLAQRSVRAPRPGVVGDVRCRPGEHLTPGQVLLSLLDERPALSIVALLPGHYRPLIAPGTPLRLELDGYRYAYQHLAVERVDDDVLGPTEARRALGAAIGDAVPLAGPVVLVHAKLPGPTFESGGRVYELHDGILGTVEMRVRSERILPALLPGLKWFFRDDE